jgi:4a-hydroxytetrahydrobiopterin dehydratase
MSDSLKERKCTPCEGGTQPLDAERIATFLAQVPGWQASDDGKRIYRRFEFKGFYKTMAFINAMAWIANQEGHHPDFEAGYNFCLVHFQTHAINGLSENDFVCAAKLNALLDD